jgi:hypothetical protein
MFKPQYNISGNYRTIHGLTITPAYTISFNSANNLLSQKSSIIFMDFNLSEKMVINNY